MRFKLTLFLLLLNLVAFAYIVRLDTRRDAEAGWQEQNRLVLPPGLAENAEELRLESTSLAQPWVLERDASGWNMRSPMQWPANPFAVERILRQLAFLQWKTSFSKAEVEKMGPGGLAAYGLSPARAVLSIRKGDQTTRLEIGEPTEVGQQLYVLSPDGGRVCVVPRELLTSLSQNLDTLLNRQVLGIPTVEVRALNLQNGTTGAARTQLERVEQAWRFLAPVQAPADATLVQAALEGLAATEIDRFVEAGASSQVLGAPSLRITFVGNNRRETLIIGAPVPAEDSKPGAPARVFAKYEDRAPLFTLARAALEPFFSAQESLRETRFLASALGQLSSLEIRQGDTTTSLQKVESGGWQVLSAVTGGELKSLPADTEKIQELIRTLADTRAMRFVSDAPSEADLEAYGFNAPQRRVTIKSPTGDTVLLLGTIDPRENRIYAKLGSSPSVYQVRLNLLYALDLSPLAYRDRSLERLAPTALIRSYRLVDTQTDRTVLEGTLPRGDTWEAITAALSGPQQQAQATILTWLRDFRVAKYVRDQFTDPFALDAQTPVPWRYRLEATVELPGAANGSSLSEHRVYRFTSLLGGTSQFGGSEQQQVVYTLAQPLIDALRPLLEADFVRPDQQLNPTEPELPAPPTTGPIPPQPQIP